MFVPIIYFLWNALKGSWLNKSIFTTFNALTSCADISHSLFLSTVLFTTTPISVSHRWSTVLATQLFPCGHRTLVPLRPQKALHMEQGARAVPYTEPLPESEWKIAGTKAAAEPVQAERMRFRLRAANNVVKIFFVLVYENGCCVELNGKKLR